MALRTNFVFNERVLADTIWLQVQGRPVPVVTMLDAATKFLRARLIKRETTQDFVQAVERGWIRMFGPPSSLHVDSHRAWGSEAFRDYTTDHDIQLVISPGEAHNRLAQLERRHHVLRRAVEIYMADKQQDTMACLKEALIYVIPQINSTLSVGGFSPTQWVLGYQPHLPGSLLDNHTNIAHLSPGEFFFSRLCKPDLRRPPLFFGRIRIFVFAALYYGNTEVSHLLFTWASAATTTARLPAWDHEFAGKGLPQLFSSRPMPPGSPRFTGWFMAPLFFARPLSMSAQTSSPTPWPWTLPALGEISGATVRTLQKANDVSLDYAPIGKPEDLVVVTFTDAAFSSRHDGASQGGYLLTLAHRSVLEDGAAGRYQILDWRSYKLARVARSTLAAESQAAGEAADSHLFAATFLKATTVPDYQFDNEGAFAWFNASALIVDAKALYDVLHRDELQVSSGSDKRTHLEILTTKDKLRESIAHVRWVSSERQYADGLTKTSAAQLLADRLRTHQFKLMDDDSYQAARKKPLAERRASANQFARSRSRTNAEDPMATSSTTSAGTVLWTTCVATCLTSHNSALALRHPSYVLTDFVRYDDIMAGILTFLALLIAFFVIYVRPPLPRLLCHLGATDNATQCSSEDFAEYVDTQDYLNADVQTTMPDVVDNYSQVPHPAAHDEGVQTEHEDSDSSEAADGPHDLGYCRVYRDGAVQTELLDPPPGALPEPSLSLEENLRRAKALNLGLGREVQLLRRKLAERPPSQGRRCRHCVHVPQRQSVALLQGLCSRKVPDQGLSDHSQAMLLLLQLRH